MLKKKKNIHPSSSTRGGNSDRKQLLADILRGMAVSLIGFTVLASASAAVLMEVGLNQIETLILFLFCCCVSAGAGGFFCARRLKKNGIVMGLAGCVPLSILILAVALLINGGQAGTNIAIMFPLTIIFGICGGVLSVNMKKRAK